MPELTNAQRNTILAALRYYQQNGQGDPNNRSDDIHDIACYGEGGEEDISLDDEGIDELCEHINFENQAPPTPPTLKRWRVYLRGQVSTDVEVEARDWQEADRLAENMAREPGFDWGEPDMDTTSTTHEEIKA